MKKFLGAVSASLILATAAIAFVLPSSALGFVSCNKTITLAKFDPASAKAGSNTVVTVTGTHLYYAYNYGTMYVGPKGNRTEVSNESYDNNAITFTVTAGSVSGPISVDVCGGTFWSKGTLRV